MNEQLPLLEQTKVKLNSDINLHTNDMFDDDTAIAIGYLAH